MVADAYQGFSKVFLEVSTVFWGAKGVLVAILGVSGDV